MTRLIWHEQETMLFEAGVDRCVFYPKDELGVVWNGILSINEVSSIDTNKLYIDGINVRNRGTTSGFNAVLEAFTYPDAFLEYDGFDDVFGQQKRKEFNLVYRTKIGNPQDGLDRGYKIHLIYNALAEPSEKPYSSLGSSADAISFNWNLTTRPMLVQGAKASAHIVIDSTKTYDWTMDILEDMLYGSEDQPPTFPTIDDVLTIFQDSSILKITDHGDGTWTAEGPDEAISMIDETTFEIAWPSAVYINYETYSIHSL